MSLKLNTFIRNINIISNNFEKLIFNTVFASFGVLALVYILILGNMVKNIVERKGLEARVYSLSEEVRNLEVSYLSMSKNIDLDLSYSLGFKDAKATFATQKSLGYKSNSDNIKVSQNDI